MDHGIAAKPRAIGVAVAAVLILAVAGSAATATAHSGSTASAGKSCRLPYATGESSVPLRFAGQDRPFLLFVPKGYRGTDPLPLVLNLHPSGSNGTQQMDISEMAAVADRHGFAVAAPNGVLPSEPGTYFWNVPGVPLVTGEMVSPDTPSDEQYLLEVLRTVEQTICTDSRRVYLTGFSGGARMASQMACDYSEVFAAVAPVAGLRAGVPEQLSDGSWKPKEATCRPERAMPVRAFHGVADDTNSYLGDQSPRWGYGVDAALTRWASLDQCRRGPSTTTITSTITRVTYSKCRDHAEVQLYRSSVGNHTWPGSSSPLIALNGVTDQSIEAGEVMWEFFQQHKLPNH